jgi:hypothetical protein
MTEEGIRKEQVSFSTSTWITLITLVATGVGTNLILIYSMSFDLQERIDALDLRWQDRISSISRSFKEDLSRVESKIPPDWFRAMVDRNSEKIDTLEAEVTRDLVRRSELKSILEQHSHRKEE